MSDVVVDDFTVSGESDAQHVDPNARVAGAEPVAEVGGAAEGDESGDAADEVDPAASEAGRTLAKQKGSYQARLNQMTAAQKQAERERDEARAEAARLKAEREAAPAAKADEKPKATEPAFYTRPEPSEDEIGTKYETWRDYMRDHANWVYDEREAKRDKETKATESERTNREAFTQVQARIAAFKAEHADYETVVASAKIPDGSPSYGAVMEHLRYSELGPQLAYELGNDPTECTRIFSLPAGFAIAALGKLEGKIESRQSAAKSGPASDAPSVTKAHPPIKPVGGSPVTSDDDGDPDDLSPAAVDKHIRTQNAKDLAARRR